MRQGEALYHLQEIDLTIQQHRERLRAIAAQLEDNAAVQAAQAQVDAAEAALKPKRAHLRDLELQLQTSKDKQQRTEKRLYAGSVKNPKELQDMQNEIESLKIWHLELEDRILEAMVAADDAQETLDDQQTTLRETTEQFEREHADLVKERDERHAQLEALKQARAQAITDIEPASLQRYKALRPQKGNRPVAKLDGSNCGVCGVQQNNVIMERVRGGEWVNCTNCGRILVIVRGA